METNILNKNYYRLQGGTILWVCRPRGDDMGDHYKPMPREARYYNDKIRKPCAIVRNGQDDFGNAIYQISNVLARVPLE